MGIVCDNGCGGANGKANGPLWAIINATIIVPFFENILPLVFYEELPEHAKVSVWQQDSELQSLTLIFQSRVGGKKFVAMAVLRRALARRVLSPA